MCVQFFQIHCIHIDNAEATGKSDSLSRYCILSTDCVVIALCMLLVKNPFCGSIYQELYFRQKFPWRSFSGEFFVREREFFCGEIFPREDFSLRSVSQGDIKIKIFTGGEHLMG